MKAIVYPKPNSLEIREVDDPKVSAGQALVKVMSSTICGTDLKILSGEFPGIKFPHIPGHEWSGEVVELATDIDELRLGDRVGAEPHVGCGRCSSCLKGFYNLCENYGNVSKGHSQIGFTEQGGMAQYAAVSIKALHRLPDRFSFDAGAFTETVSVALYAIERVGIKAGDGVLVIGPGAIGLVALQIARAKGASKVVVAGTREERLEVAKQLGADENLNISNIHDPAIQIKSMFGGNGPDVVVEAADSETDSNLAITSVKRGGRVVLVNSTSHGKNLSVDLSLIVSGHLDIFMSVENPKWVCESGISLMSGGYVKVKPLMSHGFKLQTFEKALETFRAREGATFRVMIHPNSN